MQFTHIFYDNVKRAHREIEATLTRMTTREEIPGFTIPSEPLLESKPTVQSWINLGTWRRHIWPSSIAYTCLPAQCTIEADITAHPDEAPRLAKEASEIEECCVTTIHEHTGPPLEKHVHILCIAPPHQLTTKIKKILDIASKY